MSFCMLTTLLHNRRGFLQGMLLKWLEGEKKLTDTHGWTYTKEGERILYRKCEVGMVAVWDAYKGRWYLNSILWHKLKEEKLRTPSNTKKTKLQSKGPPGSAPHLFWHQSTFAQTARLLTSHRQEGSFMLWLAVCHKILPRVESLNSNS